MQPYVLSLGPSPGLERGAGRATNLQNLRVGFWDQPANCNVTVAHIDVLVDIPLIRLWIQSLNHTDRYRASVSGSTEVSLIKGVSFNIVARYDRIKDQIALRKSSASTEEILLRLRQLATDYNYSFSVGISYSFGSVFNSHVNPRFGGPGGLVIF